MKEAIKGRTPVSMDALVHQTKSPFTVGVLHIPLPAMFRMSQTEMFEETKDPIDNLNTYKNQMELHGYQEGLSAQEPNSSICRAKQLRKNSAPKSPVAQF